MQLRWSLRALDDLQGFHDWLATLPRGKPRETIRPIREASRVLARLGDIGRPGRVPGSKELVVRGKPYIIVYRVHDRAFEIIAVYHAAQDR